MIQVSPDTVPRDMNAGRVPVDECIIQLEFEHKVTQAILNSCARLISTIGTGRQNAQGIGGASIHSALVVDGETAGRRTFGFGGNANATRRVCCTR